MFEVVIGSNDQLVLMLIRRRSAPFILTGVLTELWITGNVILKSQNNLDNDMIYFFIGFIMVSSHTFDNNPLFINKTNKQTKQRHAQILMRPRRYWHYLITFLFYFTL